MQSGWLVNTAQGYDYLSSRQPPCALPCCRPGTRRMASLPSPDNVKSGPSVSPSVSQLVCVHRASTSLQDLLPGRWTNGWMGVVQPVSIYANSRRTGSIPSLVQTGTSSAKNAPEYQQSRVTRNDDCPPHRSKTRAPAGTTSVGAAIRRLQQCNKQISRR